MSALLGIDTGTSAVKVIAIRHDGEVLASGSAAYRLYSPNPGWVEQQPGEWWEATKRATRDCLSRLPGGEAVSAVGLSGHMSGLVLVDAESIPLRPCIMLSDTRSAAQSDRLRRTLGDRIARLTGNYAVDAFVAPKLLWVKENEPEVYARAAHFLLPKDFLRLRLTGLAATEPTDAGNTLFLDPKTGQWDLELLRAMGLDERLLPPVRGTAEVVGYLTERVASELGLPSGVPVVAGAGDMACSAIGTGAVEEGVVAVTIGTAAQVLTCVPAIDPAGVGSVTFHPHAAAGTIFALGSIFSGGLSLRWLASALGEEDRLSREGGAYFEDLSAAAGAVEPGSGGALFLPFLVGSGSPFWNPTARAGWVGLTVSSRREHLVRAVMEGVAYNCRDSLEVFRRMGAPVSRIHIGGGGASSSVWRTIMAAVLGCEVVQPLNRDASALGAAALAGIGTGLYSDMRTASPALIRYGEPVAPDPAQVECYERLYPIYRRAYEALAPVTADLAAFTSKE